MTPGTNTVAVCVHHYHSVLGGTLSPLAISSDSLLTSPQAGSGSCKCASIM